MSKTQLEMYDTPEEKKQKYLSYIDRNIKKFEFYCQQKDYDWVSGALKLVRKKYHLKTNSDAILFLLKQVTDEDSAIDKETFVRKVNRKISR